jgi:hypothetical protein
MITETIIIVLKLIFISVSATVALFILTDKQYISSLYYRIKYGLMSVPGAKTGEGYLMGIFSFISSIFSMIWDNISQYALPSNPVSDIYHM